MATHYTSLPSSASRSHPSRPPLPIPSDLAPLQPSTHSSGPALPPDLSDAEIRLRALIAEQSRLSPLEELVRRSIVEGRQTPSKGSGSGIVDGLAQLLQETGDLPYGAHGGKSGGGVESLNDLGEAKEARPLRIRQAAVMPTRPLPSAPSPSTSSISASGSVSPVSDASLSHSIQRMNLQPPALQPPSASASDDEPVQPSSPDPQSAAVEGDPNDLYSRPTKLRSRLSTLGPKIRRDGPAPWEVDGLDDSPVPAHDGQRLKPSRSTPELKDEDEEGKGKRWMGGLGRKKKDREDDSGAAWKALGYAPPSPSASTNSRRPSDSSFPSSPSFQSYVTPGSPAGSHTSSTTTTADRNLKNRRSASGGLRKMFLKSPTMPTSPSMGEIQEISPPIPTPPPPNAVPIPQVLADLLEDTRRNSTRSDRTATSGSSPPPPPSPIARHRPPRLRSPHQAGFGGGGGGGPNSLSPRLDTHLELRPVSMAFSAKFTDHLQSPTASSFSDTSPRSANFGGLLSPQDQRMSIGARSFSEGARTTISEEEEDKDALIDELRRELAAERNLRKRVIEDYENRMRDLKTMFIQNGVPSVYANLPPTPQTPDVLVSPPGSPRVF